MAARCRVTITDILGVARTIEVHAYANGSGAAHQK
jgi:hypothetical protein